MSDTLTVLHAPYRRLTKVIRADGTINPFDDAKTFDMAEIDIRDLDHLAVILGKLLARPHCCIVRGAIAHPARVRAVRRLLHRCTETGDPPTIRDANRRWIGLDVEGVIRPDDITPADLAGCARHAIALLPGEFHGARCVVQATSGHGLKPGSRLRLWYWADRPLSAAELSHWLRRAPVDTCLFRPAQITYTAAPIFETGRDHLPSRLMVLDGDGTVNAPAAETLRPAPPAPLPARTAMVARGAAAERLMIAALLKVETAPEGQRHERLRAAARTLGGIMEEAQIGEYEAGQALYEAVRRAGGDAVDGRNAAATIKWGLAKGRAAPLQIGGRR